MAHLMDLDEALRTGRRILFDANILVNAFKQRGALHDLLVAVPRNRRFTLDLVKWEFLRTEEHRRRDVRERSRWLDKQGIEVDFGRPPGFADTFGAVVELPDARGDAVDGAIATYTIAARNGVAIATENGKHFCWHDRICVIAEFLRWNRPDAQVDCQ